MDMISLAQLFVDSPDERASISSSKKFEILVEI
jgi:hypothetical protein